MTTNSSGTTDSHTDKESGVPFDQLGLTGVLQTACHRNGYKYATEIQRRAIPEALKGRDIIGLAETGSGKTAAFALPILQALHENPVPYLACVVAPTRELALQISSAFNSLGSSLGVRVACIIGGTDMVVQAISLSRKPHIVIGTPGRLVDHLENTKGFSLRNLRYFVLDEADRLLDMDFGPKLETLIRLLPKDRKTYLFSATMTNKVAKLQRASLKRPVRIEVIERHKTAAKLLQYYLFFPLKHKDAYLVYLLNELARKSLIVFTATCPDALRVSFILKNLGFLATPLHGQMSQDKRAKALANFKTGASNVLVATDVAARGLDIPAVDYVINYGMPLNSKLYIHRVGRTARAGRSGKSITFVTQYDIEILQRIEDVIGKKMDLYPVESEGVRLLLDRVEEAQRIASTEMRQIAYEQRGKKRSRKMYDLDLDDTEEKEEHEADEALAMLDSRPVTNRIAPGRSCKKKG